MWIVDRSKVLMKDCYEALATFPKIGFWQIFRDTDCRFIVATFPRMDCYEALTTFPKSDCHTSYKSCVGNYSQRKEDCHHSKSTDILVHKQQSADVLA